jgi:hypothetical protein
MVYLLILFIITDLGFLLYKIFSNNAYNLPILLNIRYYSVLTVAIIAFILVGYGYYNAGRPVIREIEISTDKNISRNYRFVYASDLHINDLFFPNAVDYLVKTINAAKVDFVLFGGDVFTEDIAHLSYHDSGDHFKNIKSLYGVYTVYGNHEYIGSKTSADQHFRNYYIQVIEDSNKIINEDIMLVGRDDLSSERFFNKKRKTLSDLMTDAENSRFNIVIDHQPVSLNEAMNLPVDLILSGHTHHAQMYPFSYITMRIFDNSWGLKKFKDLYYYTSSGYGFWGPPVRVGSKSEIIIFNIIKKR